MSLFRCWMFSLRLGVLNLLSRIQQEEHIGMLYITHDLATARHFSDEIMVMCHGDIIEHGPSDDVIFESAARLHESVA